MTDTMIQNRSIHCLSLYFLATQSGCPLTTAIFAWIAANAAEELATSRPKARITPYWRTLKTGGLLNEKYPGRANRQKQLQKAEGHRIVKKGKHLMVATLEDNLYKFTKGK